MGFSVVKINRFPSIAVPGRRPFRLLFGDLPAMHGFDIDDGLSFRRTQSPNTPIAGSFIGEIPVTYQFKGTIITIHVLAMLLNHSHSRKGFFFSRSFLVLQMLNHPIQIFTGLLEVLNTILFLGIDTNI